MDWGGFGGGGEGYGKSQARFFALFLFLSSFSWFLVAREVECGSVFIIMVHFFLLLCGNYRYTVFKASVDPQPSSVPTSSPQCP